MASVKQIQVTFDCAEPERVARFWCEVLGYVVPPPPRRGLLLGTISIARCRLSIRVQRSHALIPQVWARDCSSSAFPKARSSRIGCILTCGSAPGSWVKSAWPHLRPNAHDWSRSARYACDYCLPMATTSRAAIQRHHRAGCQPGRDRLRGRPRASTGNRSRDQGRGRRLPAAAGAVRPARPHPMLSGWNGGTGGSPSPAPPTAGYALSHGSTRPSRGSIR